MRWKENLTKKFLVPGEVRIRKDFLLLPKLIKGEWRWLERTSWKEKYFASSRGHYLYWAPIMWID